MERVTRQRLVHGYNKLGASTDNLRGIQHNEGPMRPCQCCKTLVTQRWAVQTTTKSPLRPDYRYPNQAANTTIHTDLLNRICQNEPAISTTSTANYTTHETTIRNEIKATLKQSTVADLCYTCARPAMLYARQHNSEHPTTPIAHQIADYRALFQQKPTALYPSRDMDEPHMETAQTDDPWNRKRWRGKLVLNPDTRQLGMVITIAPSSIPTADPQSTAIVAFVRPCGRIDNDASRGPTLTAIDNIDKCHELPLPQLDLQHSEYLRSPQAQSWQRRANLPILQADADNINTPPTQDTPDPTKRKSPPTAADQLQERQRQRCQIRELESIVRDLSEMPAQDNDTTPATNISPATSTTPARQVLSTSEPRTRPREDTADTRIPKKKPRNRKSTGKRKKDTAARNRGRQ